MQPGYIAWYKNFTVIVKFASKSFTLKVDGIQFYKGQYCAQYHDNSIVDFHVVMDTVLPLTVTCKISTIQYSVLNK